MHDIKSIRDNPDAFDAALKRRGLAAMAEQVLAVDKALRQAQTDLQDNQSQSNAVAKEIGTAKREGKDAAPLLAKGEQIKSARAALEARERELGEQVRTVLSAIPNLPAADVPDGADADANQEVRRWGQLRNFDFKPLEHDEIGTKLGSMDFAAAAKISGARFTVLRGMLAHLERAIAGFMLDLHTREFDYTEISPPLMVRDNALYGTGQLPKFGEDLFKTTTDHWLIPTAEVPLTNLVADEILDESILPLRFTAHTPSFRSEAGAAGKDTRGMIRQHQFYKVELVSIAHPDNSEDEHQRMTACAEEVLKRLGLPFRTMALSTGDMGFSARKTYDIEVWLPGQNAYREISSCSNCGDFQARRMNARFRPKEGKGTRFVHTLNGSGLAVGRTLIAILENYQRADGTVEIPEALRHRMGGLEIITPHG
ncbi:MAG TPA: serine--tRNA ligase [Magnetospirillaceae bacterium]|jgi:seryl-tRNA synthetase